MKKTIILLIPFIFFFACQDDATLPEKLASVPLVSINTENVLPVNSKDEYINAEIKITSDNPDHELTTSLKIRGRGNSTWGFPKKPYQIKFDDKEDILGMPKDKKWILLANYSDKTMLRNELGFELGRLSNLDWTPESHFIELSINDDYLGLYQITQKIEDTSNRVDLGSEGYLLEVDQLSRLDDDDVYFETANYLFNIKEPKLTLDDEDFLFIKNYIELTESVLLGDNFMDPLEGYTKYIDVNSFIDWYLINEIAKNNDAKFHTSVYMNYKPEEKLQMGPIWDFDIGFGNINYNGNETTDGFWVKNSIWFSRLFEDPIFIEKVKSRFDYFYNNKILLKEIINCNYVFLDDAQKRNFEKWLILNIYVWPNNVFFPTYDEEIIYLTQWLDDRLEWLNVSLHEL